MHSRRQLRIQRSQCAFAPGAISGVKITRAPSDLNTRSAPRREFLVTVVNRYAQIAAILLQPPTEIPVLLGYNGLDRLGGASRAKYATCGHAHDVEYVDAIQDA